MKLSFHRSNRMNVKIKKPGEVRAFVFDASIGIGGDASQVDAESGMLINLVLVDEMLSGLRKELEAKAWSSLAEVTTFARDFIEPQVKDKNLVFSEMIFAEARGFKILWREGKWAMSQTQTLQLDEELFRVDVVSTFNEDKVMDVTSLKTISELEPAIFFKDHPDVSEFIVERLSNQEKNHYFA